MNKEAYLLWKDNEVTRQFLKEIQEGMADHVKDKCYGATVEKAGMNAIIRKAKIEVFELVLEWKPQEAEDEQDN